MSEVVEPLLHSVRSEIASLTLRARAAEQSAQQAETSVSSGTGVDVEALEAARAARRVAVDVELKARRLARDAAVVQARQDAAALIAVAREDGRSMVVEAREQLEGSLDRIDGTSHLPIATPTAGTGPDPAPVDPGPAYPPPAASPTYPPPSTAPSLPPPTVAAPFFPTFTTVLLQAPDGTLQQMLMLTQSAPSAPALSAAPQASMALAAPVVPVAASQAPIALAAPVVPVAAPPAPAIPVQESASPQPTTSAARRLLHLDVILPLLAAFIVLAVLLAWIG